MWKPLLYHSISNHPTHYICGILFHVRIVPSLALLCNANTNLRWNSPHAHSSPFFAPVVSTSLNLIVGTPFPFCCPFAATSPLSPPTLFLPNQPMNGPRLLSGLEEGET